MTSAVEHTDRSQQSEPPAKRRRGGRRSSNPEISAEERKRLRVLKNRESAMRSLAKKAEYSAKLANMEKQAISEYKSSRDSLEQLIADAIALRAALGKVPENDDKLLSDAETLINRGTTALADDDQEYGNSVPGESLDGAHGQSGSGDSADGS